MTSRAAKFSLYLIVCGLTATCVGCSDRNLFNKRHFVLDVNRLGEDSVADGAVILEVRRLTIDSRFDTKDLVYRKGEFEYEADFHNEYLVAPEAMITDQVRRWLSNTGLFKKVVEPGSLLEPTHTMEGTITSLYADFADESAPAAVMEIDFLVIVNEPSEDKLVYSRSYRASQPIGNRSADGIIEGMNQCLEEILRSLEEGIKAKP